MGILVHATPDDLVDGDWFESVPVGAASLLRSASILVSKATRHDRYDTTPAGAPSDPTIAEAFRDATCQQVTEWIAAKVDPNKGAFGQDLQIGSQSVPGGSVTYAGQATVEQRAKAATQLSELAFDVLTNAGLGTRAPRYL